MKFQFIFALLNAVAILPELERIATDITPRLTHITEPTVHLPHANNQVNELHVPAFFLSKPKTTNPIPETATRRGRLVVANVEQRGRFTVTTYVTEDVKPSKRHTLESQKSFIRNHLPDSDRQGDIDACHIFATLEVLHGYTGVRLSKAKAFLDHLFSQLNPAPLTGSIDLHLRHLANTQLDIAAGAAKSSCGRIRGWEGGTFLNNMALLKETGGVIVPNNADWKDIERLFGVLDTEKNAILKGGLLSDEDKRIRLSNAGLIEMFTKAKDPKDVASRNTVKAMLNGLNPVEIVNYDETLDPKEVSVRLVKALHEKGSVYVSINGANYYDAMDGLPVVVSAHNRGDGDHGVALVGYSVSKDVFYIKDSNKNKIVKMRSTDFSKAVRAAWALQRI